MKNDITTSESWTENARTLRASVRGEILGEQIITSTRLEIEFAGRTEAVESIIEQAGRHGARLYRPATVNGKQVAIVGITDAQHRACQVWLASAHAQIRQQLSEQTEARETIEIEWGGPAGFMGEERRRGRLIESHLTLAGITWSTDWDLRQPHRATLPRAQWKTIEAEIQAEIDRQNSRIEHTVNNPERGNPQLWEPCEKCGCEPSYQTAKGHLCAGCQ